MAIVVVVIVWGTALAEWGASDLTWILAFLVEVKGRAVIGLNWLVAFAFTYGKEIIGLLGGTYGILNWWYYREAVLHERLESYLKREDARLKDARTALLDTVARPGTRRQFVEPLFAVGPLRKLLKRRNLDAVWGWQTPERAAERQLSAAAHSIREKRKILEEARLAYREQTITLHMLSGSIAASMAQRRLSTSRRYRAKAWREFRIVLAAPGSAHRAFALEQIGHQLRCLDRLEDAGRVYDQLQEEIGREPSGRDKDLKLANALRWRAVVYQAVRWYDGTPGKGSTYARDCIGAGVELSGALKFRQAYEPFDRWDAVEHGDMHYTAAFIAKNLNSNVIATDRLESAKTSYDHADPHPGRPLFLIRGATRKLAKAARAGTKRVGDAEKGEYDLRWLLPPPPAAFSDQPQTQTKPVGGGGGEEGVPQTS